MDSPIEELLPVEIDDISDPSNLDGILLKLDDIMTEDENFMEVLIENTKPRHIYWAQPWYQQTGPISRPIKDNSEHKEYRVDAISSEEVEKIEKNWRKMVKKYNLPDKIICLARWRSSVRNSTSPGDKARLFAVSFLARGLQRTVYHVFRFLLRHYAAPVKQIKFSKDEEKVIQILLCHQPNNAVVIASKILKREPRGISKKINQIINGKELLPRLKWNLELLTKFVKLLMILNETKNINDLKYRRFSKEVWLKAEEEMGQHYYRLQNQWYYKIHVQLFVKEPMSLKKLQKRVFKKLQKSTYRIWSDIRWKQLLQYFPDGFTHLFLYRTCYPIIGRKKICLKTPLPQLIDYALQQIKNSKTNRRLKILVFNDKQELEFR